MRDESYYFEKGKVVGAFAYEWWDVDKPEDAPGPTRARRYYFIGNDCYFQMGGDAGGRCPQVCAPEARAKIVARAEQVVIAADAKGAALEEIAEKLESWIESLD